MAVLVMRHRNRRTSVNSASGWLAAAVLFLVADANWSIGGQPGQMDSAASRGPLVRVAFRFDDVSADSPISLERQIISTFEKHGGHHTFAVVPAMPAAAGGGSSDPSHRTLPTEKLELLRTAAASGRLEIALHGLTHQRRQQGRSTEFSGVPLDEQVLKVKEGLRLLSEIAPSGIVTFVPPWNSYDDNTVAVVAQLGMDLISANLRGPYPASKTQVSFLPYTCELSEVRPAVCRALAAGDPQAVIVVVYHPFDFAEVESLRGHRIARYVSEGTRGCWTLGAFDNLVGWCASQPGVVLSSLREVREAQANELTVERLSSNARLLRVVWPWPFSGPQVVYWSQRNSENLLGRIWVEHALSAVLYAGLMIVPGLAAVLGAVVASRWFSHAFRHVHWLGLAQFLCLLVAGCYDGDLGRRGVTIVLLSGGLYVGLLCHRICVLPRQVARRRDHPFRESEL